MVFLPSLKAIHVFRRQLAVFPCPTCHRRGALRRHGFIRGYISSSSKGIRAWRVFCKPRHGGCGRSFSLRRSRSLPRCCFSSIQLSSFINHLSKNTSIKAAWEASDLPLSLDSAYRLVQQIQRLIPILRSRLFPRGPPPDRMMATSPLHELLILLSEQLGAKDPVAAFQLRFQLPFLAAR